MKIYKVRRKPKHPSASKSKVVIYPCPFHFNVGVHVVVTPFEEFRNIMLEYRKAKARVKILEDEIETRVNFINNQTHRLKNKASQ